MYSKWTSHLKTPEEKEQFKNSVLGSKRVLQRLQEVLDEMETEVMKAEINPKTYEIPNWANRQAHNNGYRQCLFLVKKLIDLDQQETKSEKIN
jgi:hypothetical protein